MPGLAVDQSQQQQQQQQQPAPAPAPAPTPLPTASQPPQRAVVHQTPVPVPVIPTSAAVAAAAAAAAVKPTTKKLSNVPRTAATTAAPKPTKGLKPSHGATSSQTSASLPPLNTGSKAASPPRKPASQHERPPRDRRPSSSPQRPTYSPITPPLNPVQFPPPRQTYAHSSQTTATAIPPPRVEPIEFDTNPDVLALKSAISLLQMQSAKARRDMVALQKAKTAALDDPGAFVADLTSGKVTMRDGELRSARPRADDDTSSSEDEDENGDGDERMEGSVAGPGAQGKPPKSSKGSNKKKKKTKPSAATAPAPASASTPLDDNEPRPWATLPSQQNIYRCPPINWSQYAVVGDSLDKLHNEQLARPAQGVPATATPDGRFEINKPGPGPGPGPPPGRQSEYVGVQAPYDALRDKLPDKKRPRPPG